MNNKSQTLSVVIVTDNAGSTLEQALESVRWADEIIVVDRGSTDETLAIAQRFTERVFYHPSPEYAQVRHYGFQQAKSNWILWIEPWEWVEDLLKHELDGILLNAASRSEAYSIAQRVRWQKRPIGVMIGEAPESVRLFRKDPAHLNAILPEEPPYAATQVVRRLEHCLGSMPYSSIEALFVAVNERSTRNATLLLERDGIRSGGASGFTLVFKACATFLTRFIFQSGWKSGLGGLLLAMAESQMVFLTGAKLRQLYQS